ncbi:MAG: hypothetical protein ACYCY3_04965 [Halothiobacillus sp.]
MEPNGPADIVRWMDENLFHFSCKTVNSNTAAGGVRLGADQALDLPYVGARTLLSEGRSIGLDYLVNAGSDATVFKRVRQSIGEIDPNDINGPVFRQAVSEKYQVLSGQRRVRGLDSVSPRLRQLLIPVHGQARYVALTPLGSAGLCETVKAVSRQRQEERKAEIKVGSPIGFDSAINQFSVGGSNPQNVGGRVRAMSHPLVFDRVPTQNDELRTALSIHYRGFRPRLPRALVLPYAQWLGAVRNEDRTMTSALRLQETTLVRPMIRAAQSQARKAEAMRDKYIESLPDEASALSDFLESWIDPSRTNAHHRYHWLIDALSGYRLGASSSGDPIRLTLTPEDARRLMNLVEEI